MTDIRAEAIVAFARAALTNGMVYLCAWGAGCERFHDLVDEIVVADDIGERLYAGPKDQDTIMTTWHENETLEEALDFFVRWSLPTEGFEPESGHWLAMSAGDPGWITTIRRRLDENPK
jgi:hypothetical protein